LRSGLQQEIPMTKSQPTAQATATNPASQLRDLVSGYLVSRAIYVAAELNLAGLLAGGAQDSETLAAAVGAHAPTMYRLLRALASVGVFQEDERGRFANTELSDLLRPDTPGSLRAMVRMFGDDPHWKSAGALAHSVRTGEPAFDHVFGMHLFDYFARDSASAKIFDEAMVSVSALTNRAMLQAYDFSAFQSLVDVGGGSGGALCAMLHAAPGLRGVLFDLPHAAEGARRYVAEQGLIERCEIVEGSFFDSVPSGADAYFMKHIIHDWDDERCLRLLRNCHAAMRPEGKLLVCEKIVPAGNGPSFAKISDLVMLVNTPGGRERSEAEYRELFASSGFRLTRVVPMRSDNSLLESVRV
jgi:hypothetical protein